MPEATLQITDGSLAFPNLILIEDLNLSVHAGDHIALLGPNGSGKSTLLSVLLGERTLPCGSLTSTFRRIGFVPQWKKVEFQYPLTVERLLGLAFPLPACTFKARHKRREAIDAMLDRVQMADRRQRLLRECSGGELQRAFLARAFLLEPDLLLLDEPISAVDQQGRNVILELLREYCSNRNPAVVLTIHDHDPGWQQFFTRRLHISDRRLKEEP